MVNPVICGIIGQVCVEQGCMLSSFMLELMPDLENDSTYIGPATVDLEQAHCALGN